MKATNGYTRKEALSALYGHRQDGERKHQGRYVLEKLIEGSWIPMSHGDADRNARFGHELDHFIKQAQALEGQTRLRNTKSSAVVWPREQQQ